MGRKEQGRSHHGDKKPHETNCSGKAGSRICPLLREEEGRPRRTAAPPPAADGKNDLAVGGIGSAFTRQKKVHFVTEEELKQGQQHHDGGAADYLLCQR
mmetsp:Transcript_18803/g.42748  ORF Transcript_18803/g.42748 Transcript_18803/m.42748 type:complete len:99 (+) Transcript_18803:116-412(+)